MITYDAWKYANDSFRRMFLLQLQNELNFEQSEFMNSFYYNTTSDTKVNVKLNTKRIILFIIISIILSFGIYFLPIPIEFKFTTAAILPLVTLSATLYFKMFDDLKVSVQKPHIFAPEQFEECFNQMVEKSLKKYSNIDKGIKYVKGENYEKDIDRLIIVIDNIDRCNKELAYELLTNIKNFLGDNHSIIFIIPVDADALKRHVINTTKSEIDCNKESDEFLRKFFNVAIKIKPYHTEEMFDFADKLNKRYNLNFEPTTISLVSNEFASNPRRIIQMFNNLAVELECFPEDLSEKNQAVVCKLLIIREEFPDYYTKIVESPYVLFDEVRPDDNKNDDKLGIFLYKTFAVTSSYINKLNIIEKILSNSNVFDVISKSVVEYVNKADSYSLIEYLKKHQIEKSDIINYLINKLSGSLKRLLFETDVRNNLILLLKISQEIGISNEDNIRIIDIIKADDILDKIMPNLNSYKDIIIFGVKLEEQGLNKLTNFIVKRIKNELVESPQISKEILEATFFGCSVWSENHVNSMKDSFLLAYKEDLIDESWLKYDYGNKYKIVLSSKLIDYVIDNISIQENNNSFTSRLNKICEKTVLSSAQVDKYLSKMNSIMPNYSYSPDNSIIINNCLLKVNSTLKLCTGNLIISDSIIVEMFNKITLNNRYGNYVERSINDSEMTQTVIDFLYYANILLKENFPSFDIFACLFNSTNNRGYFYSKLVELSDAGLSLKQYWNIILQDNSYTSNYIKLLEYIFTYEDLESKTILDDDRIRTKLNEILSIVLSGNDKMEELIILIHNLTSIERVKLIMTNLLSIQTPENITKLPLEFQVLASNTIAEHINDYENNINALLLIAKSDSKKYIKKLVPLIIKKLNTPDDYEFAFKLIINLKNLSITEKKSILSNLNLLKENNGSQNDNIDECIEKIRSL